MKAKESLRNLVLNSKELFQRVNDEYELSNADRKSLVSFYLEVLDVAVNPSYE